MQTSSPARADGVDPDELLTRALGTRQLTANIFNYTVGSGIFALPAFAVMQLGQAAPLAYLACALIIGLVVLCFAEAGSRVSATGGPYAWVSKAWHWPTTALRRWRVRPARSSVRSDEP